MKTQAYLLLFVMLAVAHTQMLKVQTNRFAQPRNVSYDRVAVTIDGQRKFIISGAIHYPRSTPVRFIRHFNFAVHVASAISTNC
jgi:hypothetical protein